MNRILVLLFLTLILIKTSSSQDFPVDQVIDTVICKGDSSYSYALYLPPYYGDFKEWPVIYAFDPAARGSLPVNLFKEAARKFGFIIVGSNDSKNGPWDPIFHAAQNMFIDTKERFYIDPRRIYLAGFSGGSRVASTIGMKASEIAGVIGCGAGFDQGHPPNYNLSFDYFGLIGNMDFNYQEMKNLEIWLTMFKAKQEIDVFEGGHDWPPPQNIMNALTWLEFRAMEDETRPLRNDRVREFIASREEWAGEALENGNPHEAYLAYNQIIDYIGSLADTRDYKARIDQLLLNQYVKSYIKKEREIRTIETDFIKECRDAFRGYRSIDYEYGVAIERMSFWKDKVREANRYIRKAETRQDTLLGFRLIDYIWRSASMLYESVNHTDEHILVPTYLEIWMIAKPEHAAPYYYLARYYSELGDRGKSVKYLEEAVKKGFYKIEYVESDTSFRKLLDSGYYERFLDKNSFSTEDNEGSSAGQIE